MEMVFSQLLSLLSALWWPFCRVLAALAAAPVLGETMVPVTVRVLLALVLAVALLPAVQTPLAIDPWSMQGVMASVQEAVIGFVLGMAFHLVMAIVMVLGYLVSSQMGLSMAVMNDPLNGTSSDVVSTLLSILFILVFFAVDGHLVFTGVIGASFRAWPVGTGIELLSLQTLAFNVAWVFSAAMLLAVPVIFSTLVVQFGFGFLNRIAPSFNLFSLGFSLVTLFGLFMLSHLVRFLPEHYLRMTNQVLEMLHQGLRAVPHG
ncbi:MAG: fliR [Rhodocyclaceae bacterium]|nr:fliR [Rhodocyclaceae bacterium]